MRKSILAGLVFLNGIAMVAQSKDDQMLKDIYKSHLTNAKIYSWLENLSIKMAGKLYG